MWDYVKCPKFNSDKRFSCVFGNACHRLEVVDISNHDLGSEIHLRLWKLCLKENGQIEKILIEGIPESLEENVLKEWLINNDVPEWMIESNVPISMQYDIKKYLQKTNLSQFTQKSILKLTGEQVGIPKWEIIEEYYCGHEDFMIRQLAKWSFKYPVKHHANVS